MGGIVKFDVVIRSPHLWSLEDPYLYEVTAVLDGPGEADDVVQTYFGMRKIGAGKLPGTQAFLQACAGVWCPMGEFGQIVIVESPITSEVCNHPRFDQRGIQLDVLTFRGYREYSP